MTADELQELRRKVAELEDELRESRGALQEAQSELLDFMDKAVAVEAEMEQESAQHRSTKESLEKSNDVLRAEVDNWKVRHWRVPSPMLRFSR